MQEFAKSDPPSTGGRHAFVPTREQRDTVMLLIAASFSEPQIAAVIGICQNTLRRHFAQELQNGRAVRRGENLRRLEQAAAAGHVGAMKVLEAIFDRAETRQLGKGKVEAGPTTKKAAAARAAVTAGQGSEWGDDLVWPSRPR
jgi:hypothetical protein